MESLENKASDYNVKIADLNEFTNYQLMININGENLKTAMRAENIGIDDINVIQVYSLDDYNKIEGESIELKDDEALIFSVSKEYENESIVINGNSFKVAKKLENFKKVINKQVLMVFFFPLGIALTHTAFAFKPISKLLGLFGLFDTKVFLIATIITATMFIVLYVIVYSITSNTYYKVVQQE